MARARVRNEDGFTIVEVMVALSVLLIGVLGTVMMIDGANAQTSRTKAREGGTALARTVLEVARGVPYEDLTSGRVLAELQSRPGLGDADVTTPGHQIESRNFTYTVVPTVCSMDDPKDSLGVHDEVGIVFCPDSGEWSAGNVDRNPDDYRRVSIHLTWKIGPTIVDSTTQTGIVTNPVGGLGPSVTSLTPHIPSTATVTGAETTEASYNVITSTSAAQVTWLVNGSRRAPDAEGSGTEWGFTWSLGDVDDPVVPDCTYILQAEAVDDKGRAGSPKALTVQINRRKPFGPADFVGGRNLEGDHVEGDHVDLQWSANRECDVTEYRVYRIDGAVETLVCAVPSGAGTDCVDTGAPSSGALTYEIVARDVDPNGVARDGDRVQWVVADDANLPPDTPDPLFLCIGGSENCVDIEGNETASGTAVLSWAPVEDPDGDEIAFYRIYRDGTDYEDRIGVLFPVIDGSTGLPVDPLVYLDGTVTGDHDYYVTAVDERFGESAPLPEPAEFRP